MPANPLGVALRNRRAGHDSLVWARPDLQAPEKLHPDQPRLRPRGAYPGKAPRQAVQREHLARAQLDAAAGRHR